MGCGSSCNQPTVKSEISFYGNYNHNISIDEDQFLSASSFSYYSNHAVMIKEDGTMLAIGENCDGQIIGSLPMNNLEQFIDFKIKDDKNHFWLPISALCGSNYTLYLVSYSEENNIKSLAYSYEGIETYYPLFLNHGNLNPIALFGGSKNAAAIDSEGSIIFIPESVKKYPTEQIEAVFLPDGEKAISVACCDNFVVALSSNGRVFMSDIMKTKGISKLIFKPIESLKKLKIVGISGVNDHCFAVTENGYVYGFGSNVYYKLGLGKKIKAVNKFTKISSLKNIEAAYAGSNHSLFQTEDNKLLVCGSNIFGELIDAEIDDLVYYPQILTNVQNVKFCIAGDGISVILKYYIPDKSPNLLTNKKIDNSCVSIKKMKAIDEVPVVCINVSEEKKYYSIKIGEGETSIVYKVTDKRKNLSICKKVLKYKNGQASIKDAQRALKEFEVLHQVSHPCICKAIDIDLEEPLEICNKKGEIEKITTIAIYLEYIENNFSDILNKNISNTLKVKFVIEIAHAMNFLHKKGIIHRDLKIDNIMVNNLDEIKIVDFGLIKIFESIFF